MPAHTKVKTISGFKGLNNVLKPESTPEDYLKVANNINIDKQGKISTRKGYSLIAPGLYTSLWSNDKVCYAVEDGDLYEILPDHSLHLLKIDVGHSPLSFEEVNGDVYYISRESKGIISGLEVHPWGLEIPNTFLNPIQTTGILSEGTYQLTYTYVTSEGLESGCSYSTQIIVPDNSGISVDIPLSSDPEVVMSRVYCSTPNGTVLYYAGQASPGDTYVISDSSLFSSPLSMFNLEPPPLADSVSYYKGRLFIADGRTLWYSEPNQYQHFKMDSNYIELPDDIVSVIPVEDGIWVGSDHIYYLSGSDPDSFKLTLKERVQVVPGTATRLSGSYIQLDNTPIGYKWLVTTNLGIFVLFNQGMIINLTATNLSLERGKRGTAIFLQDEGTNQYLSTIEKENKPNNSVMGDIVTTTVIRNGVIIQE